jgi:hypothetical protein
MTVSHFRHQTVTYLVVCDYRRGMDLWIWFVDHLSTPLGTTLYSSLKQTSVLSLLYSPLSITL